MANPDCMKKIIPPQTTKRKLRRLSCLESCDSWYGEEGDYFWLGYAGTNFLISPKNKFIFIFMAQQVGTALSNRNMMFELVKDIFID